MQISGCVLHLLDIGFPYTVIIRSRAQRTSAFCPLRRCDPMHRAPMTEGQGLRLPLLRFVRTAAPLIVHPARGGSGAQVACIG